MRFVWIFCGMFYCLALDTYPQTSRPKQTASILGAIRKGGCGLKKTPEAGTWILESPQIDNLTHWVSSLLPLSGWRSPSRYSCTQAQQKVLRDGMTPWGICFQLSLDLIGQQSKNRKSDTNIMKAMVFLMVPETADRDQLTVQGSM